MSPPYMPVSPTSSPVFSSDSPSIAPIAPIAPGPVSPSVSMSIAPVKSSKDSGSSDHDYGDGDNGDGDGDGDDDDDDDGDDGDGDDYDGDGDGDGDDGVESKTDRPSDKEPCNIYSSSSYNSTTELLMLQSSLSTYQLSTSLLIMFSICSILIHCVVCLKARRVTYEDGDDDDPGGQIEMIDGPGIHGSRFDEGRGDGQGMEGGEGGGSGMGGGNRGTSTSRLNPFSMFVSRGGNLSEDDDANPFTTKGYSSGGDDDFYNEDEENGMSNQSTYEGGTSQGETSSGMRGRGQREWEREQGRTIEEHDSSQRNSVRGDKNRKEGEERGVDDRRSKKKSSSAKHSSSSSSSSRSRRGGSSSSRNSSNSSSGSKSSRNPQGAGMLSSVWPTGAPTAAELIGSSSASSAPPYKPLDNRDSSSSDECGRGRG